MDNRDIVLDCENVNMTVRILGFLKSASFCWNDKKVLLDKNSLKRSSVHCWCNLVAVRAASFDNKKFLIFQGGQWFVDQLWERWNQWVKNGSQWSSNYNLSSLEINGPSPPVEEDFHQVPQKAGKDQRGIILFKNVWQN